MTLGKFGAGVEEGERSEWVVQGLDLHNYCVSLPHYSSFLSSVLIKLAAKYSNKTAGMDLERPICNQVAYQDVNKKNIFAYLFLVI